MKPTHYRVTWPTQPDRPAGHIDRTQRAQARGDKLILTAQGVTGVQVRPVWKISKINQASRGAL